MTDTNPRNWKALCTELAEVLAEEHGVQREFDGGGPLLGSGVIELLSRVRTELSKPEPEELTDEEIVDEARKYLVNEYGLAAEITYLLEPDIFEYEPTIGCFRAVIAADRARWGRPTTTQENN